MDKTRIGFMRTKMVKIILLISIFVVISLLTIYWIFYQESPFIENKSPNEINIVKITEYGNGIWNGSERIKIYFKNSQGLVERKK